MKISCRRKIAIHSRKDAILIPVYKNIKPLRLITGKKIDDELHEIIQSDYFNFEEKEIKSFYMELNRKLKKIYLIHAPKEQEAARQYMALGAKMAHILKSDKITTFSIISFEDIYNEKRDFSSTQGFIEGLMFGMYGYDRFKTKKDVHTLMEIEVITGMLKLKRFIDEKAEEWNTVFENVNLARDLTNTPPNYMTPEIFAKTAVKEAPKDMKVTVWDIRGIRENSLNLVEAVGRGSANKPYFLKIEYAGNPASESNVALVGKGVTFDSGGSNLKPTGSMENMKTDMAGAAAVYAAVKLAADMKLKVNINAYIPLVENIIGGDAIRPGDIVASASGKTVEIMNTDAEGRLILADALYTATKTDPEVIIDAATLTGGCVVALGPFCAGLFTNRKFLSKQVSDISDETAEDVWELPLFEDYAKGINSKTADMQNMSTFKREGSAIHAALFLRQFVDNYPWIHFDIAGTAWLDTPHPIFGTGASGFGVRLLYRFIEAHYCERSDD